MKKNISYKKIFFLIILISTTLYYCYLFVFGSVTKLLAGKPDDLGYYLKVAENIAQLNKSTFDGIHLTNGYHPLWQALLIPIATFTNQNHGLLLRCTLLFQLVLLFISTILFSNYIEYHFGPGNSALAGIMFISIVFIQALNGMESALLVFLICFWLWRFYKYNEKHRYKYEIINYIYEGIILGLVILARLDLIFILVGYLVALSFSYVTNYNNRKVIAKRTFYTITTSIIILIPYLLYNYIGWNSIVPNSGRLKSSFPIIQLNGLKSMLTYSKFGYIYFLIGILSFYTMVYYTKNKKMLFSLSYQKYQFNISFLILTMCIFSHFFYTLFFTMWGIANYYFVIYGFLLIIIFIQIVKYVSQKFLDIISNRKIFLYLLLLLVFAALIPLRIMELQNKKMFVRSYEAANWIRNNTLANVVIGTEDSGIIGLFSDRRVINLDGIMNDDDYQIILKQHQLKNYLLVNKVGVFIKYAVYDNPNVIDDKYNLYLKRFYSYQFKCYSDTLELFRKNEMLRIGPDNSFDRKSVLIAWRINN